MRHLAATEGLNPNIKCVDLSVIFILINLKSEMNISDQMITTVVPGFTGSL